MQKWVKSTSLLWGAISPSAVGAKSKCYQCHLEYLEIIICTSEKALFRVCRVFVCLTAEGIILHQSQCSSGSSSLTRTPSSPFSYMTSARLSLTLFLCLVLALKAAELKRCCWTEKIKKHECNNIYILFSGCNHTGWLFFISCSWTSRAAAWMREWVEKYWKMQLYTPFPLCRLRFKDRRAAVTFSNREILLPLTVASRMSGGPRPKMSLSSGLNCTKAKTHTTINTHVQLT